MLLIDSPPRIGGDMDSKKILLTLAISHATNLMRDILDSYVFCDEIDRELNAIVNKYINKHSSHQIDIGDDNEVC